MAKYILEWGWDRPDAQSASAKPEWKPAPTMLGGAEPDQKVAAAGDLKCQAICASGGSYGTTGSYRVEDKVMCRSCAVKTLKIEALPGGMQNDRLRGYELK